MSQDRVIRVFLADDHPLLRIGLKLSFQEESDLVVVGEAENGFLAIEKIQSDPPDVVLLDVNMPGLSGIAAIRVLRRSLSQMKIVVLSTYNDSHYVQEAMQAGADGYVLKSVDVSELKRIIRCFAAGQKVMSAYLLNHSIEVPPQDSLDVMLTRREQEILAAIAEGKANKEIAAALFVTTETVKTHVKNIYRKLQVKNRVEATQVANRRNLLTN